MLMPSDYFASRYDMSYLNKWILDTDTSNFLSNNLYLQ